MIKQPKKSERVEPRARRESGHPYYSYARALALATAVKECGGSRSPIPRSVIAKALKADQTSASFYQVAASAKTFGIIAGSRELQLTEAGKRYFYPVGETDRKAAEL